MKLQLFLFMFLLSVGSLSAQELYIPGKVTEGKDASYYCSHTNALIVLRNVQNRDTTKIVYDKNGKVVDYILSIYPSHPFKNYFVSILKEILTKEEWNELIEKNRFILHMLFLLDQTGGIKEITFKFSKRNTVFPKFSPDRFYLLEQKIKQNFKFDLTSEQKNHKNPKSYFTIGSRDLIKL